MLPNEYAVFSMSAKCSLDAGVFNDAGGRFLTHKAFQV